MPNIADQLELRSRLIAHAVVGAWRPRKWEWWAGYDWHHRLHVDKWGDSKVIYRRGGGSSPMLELTNIQPKRVRGLKESEPVLLDAKVIDAFSLDVSNGGTEGDLPWEYTGEFEKTRTKREAFEASFNQSISNTFTAGNDTTPVKNEVTVALGFSQTTKEEDEKAERVNRAFKFGGSTPASVNAKVTASRKVSRMKTTLTGTGDYEHSIRIGKHWHGKWQGGNHRWETFADFLRTVKGDAPSHFALANEFRHHRAPGWLIHDLEKPISVPFTMTLEFDEATSVDLRRETY